ncbi:hypothetical protein NXS98_02440 [Fontisphaera persica]|uniref:hypothetical protein n=1 Tax=Fontisphaera persica TaxID=2974023 RepID=UPI0024C01040|nr:hypothetical protein [Fontisphaera persica]WCJ60006.1 hypothetical protein NXS98_02440 [Fontisphaera persica]
MGLAIRAAETPAKPPASQDAVRWEYAYFRFAGDQTTIVWPDGTTQRVIPFGGRRRPEKADERMWYITGGINILAAKGFEIAWMDEDDVIMRRRVVEKPEEAPADKKSP